MQDDVWLSVAELARRKGVSKQAISKRVKALEAEGRLTTRLEGQSRLVGLVDYDRAVAATGNASRETAAKTVRFIQTGADEAPAIVPDEGEIKANRLRDAQTENTIYAAKMRALDYGERTGQLLPAVGANSVEEAMVEAAQAMVAMLELPLQHYVDLAEAIKLGEPEFRRAFKGIIYKQRLGIAKAMKMMEHDGLRQERAGLTKTKIISPEMVF